MSAPIPAVSFAPTPEQSAILDAVRTLQPGELLKVQARAGTGKTSTLELLARADSRAMLYLAFNRDIAEAAKKRFPSAVTVKTTHGLAWSALGVQEWIPTKGAPRTLRAWELERWLSVRRWHPSIKTGASQSNVATDLLATVRAFMQSADAVLERQHVRCGTKTNLNAFKAAAMSANPADPKLAERDAWAGFGRYQGWLLEKAAALWNAMTDREDSSVPLEHDAYLKLYQLQGPELDWPLILMDEAQDLNPCVMALFLSQPAAKIMVGDDSQSIYAFRGAVDALKTPGRELPLLQSFRFGPAIAEVANQVLAFKSAYWSGFHALRGFEQRKSVIGPVVAPPYTVICRSNQGVFHAALKAVMAGLTINSGAKDLEESILYVESAWSLLTGERLPKLHPEIAEFGGWAMLEQESQSDQGLQWLVRLVTDYREDMPDICRKLRAAKTRMKKSADVLLVTAHKSKGLEFDQVILADDFTSLDKVLGAALNATDIQEREAVLAQLPEQELHLLYVAATRAQKRLQPNQTLETMSNLSDSLEKIRARARANKAAEAPPAVALVARQTPEQRQQCFDARVAEFMRAGMTHEEAVAATAKEGW